MSDAAASSLVTTRGKIRTDRETVCERPSQRLVWLTASGEVAPVRCGSPNKCWGCAMITAFENALVVRLDAFDGGRWPTWGLTTTTRTPGFEQKALRRCEEFLYRRLRKDFAECDIQYLGFVEFTTGRAGSSGGARRPHVHHLVKGIPGRTNATALEARVSELWYRYTGDAWRVECRLDACRGSLR